MTHPSRLASPVALAALLACATAPPGPPLRMTDMPAQPPAKAEEAAFMGEIQWAGAGARSAAYSQWRVAGPTVNVSYTGNNTWAGTLDGRNFLVTTEPGRILGAGIDLHLFQEGDAIVIRGQWFQRSFWLTMSPKRLSGHSAMNPGIDLERVSPEVYRGLAGSGISSSLLLKGGAAQFPSVIAPHFYLALLAAIP